MRLKPVEIAEAERQIDTAALIAALLGALSLWVGIRTWRERMYLDLETLLGLLDSIALGILAASLKHHFRWAPFLLLLLVVLGVINTFWRGFPLITLLPQVVAGVFYVRAEGALRRLRQGDWLGG